MEWSFDTHDAQATRRARRDFVARVCAVYGEEADCTAAELVLGELIGNVVRHAPGRAEVRATFDSTGVTIAVQDFGSGLSEPSVNYETTLLGESGRGLAIVSTLARKVEIDCRPRDGCCIRARLDLRADAEHAAT